MTYATDREQFDIRNHTDKLEPKKGNNRFFCPTCNGSLTVNKDNGAYSCWGENCDRRGIRMFLNPSSSDKESTPFNKPQKIQLIPALIPSGIINLGFLPSNIDVPKIQKKTNITETIYKYSDTQCVIRIDRLDGSKDTFPHYIKDGKRIRGKGDASWNPYRLEEILNHCKGRWLVIVEGEKCVEIVRSHFGVVATTFQGSCWGKNQIIEYFLDFKKAGISGVIYYPDHDTAGYHKADECCFAADKARLPYLQIQPLRLWGGTPNKGDIADWVKEGLGTKELLLAEIELIANEKREKQKSRFDLVKQINDNASKEGEVSVDSLNVLLEFLQKEQEITPNIPDSLKLQESIEHIQSADSLWDAAIYSRDLSLEMKIPLREIETIITKSETFAKPLPQIINVYDFLQKEFAETSWIYPGIIPANAVTIVGGKPGSGKSSLCFFILFCFLSKLPFLEESPSILCEKRQRGLIINSDQQGNEAQLMLDEMTYKTKMPISSLKNCDIIEDWCASPIGFKYLEDIIMQIDYTFIVIDSYAAIHKWDATFDENTPKADASIRKLQKIAEKYKVTILVIHHAGKNDYAKGVNKIRGSGAIVGAASAVLYFDHMEDSKGQTSDPAVRKLEVLKIRNSPPCTMFVRLDENTLGFNLRPDNDSNNRKRLNATADKIYNKFFICKTNEISVKYLSNQLDANISHNKLLFAQKILDKLVQRGTVQRFTDPSNEREKLYRARELESEDLAQDGFDDSINMLDEVITNNEDNYTENFI